MKAAKAKHILIYLCLAIFSIACNDWLYLEPEDGIIRDEFWASKQDVRLAVIGCYGSLLGNTGGEKTYDLPSLLFILGEIRADMMIMRRENAEYRALINGDIFPDNGLCRWDAFYRTINFCNNVLTYAKIVQEEDPSFSVQELKEFEAEVLALRALMYFYLVRLYKEVPLKLTATLSDDDNVPISKSPPDEILKQIKADLFMAEKDVPVAYGSNDMDKGRITRYGVNAIQADVYLWCEQYDSAVLACNKVINSGKYGIVANDENWFKTLYVNGNSSEGIFELQFHKDRLNPYYRLLSPFRNYNFIGSPLILSDLFLSDPALPPDSADIRSDGASYKSGSGYIIWKYLGRDRDVERTEEESYAHFIVYRYADILLLKAEALNQLGFGEEALSLVNILRNRAHASTLTKYPGSTDDINSLADYILEERGREFAFEGKRWFDILRNGKRNNYQRLDIITGALSTGVSYDKQITIMAKAQDTLFHYLPIHINELNTNPELEQNPFYDN